MIKNICDCCFIKNFLKTFNLNGVLQTSVLKKDGHKSNNFASTIIKNKEKKFSNKEEIKKHTKFNAKFSKIFTKISLIIAMIAVVKQCVTLMVSTRSTTFKMKNLMNY